MIVAVTQVEYARLVWRVSGAIGVALIAACSFDGVDPAASDGGAAGVDAPDVTVDANLRMACDDFTPKSSYIVPCDIPDPLGALMIGGTYIFDSDNGTLTSPVGLPDLTVASYVRGNAPTDPRVMSVTSLQIGASGSLRLLGDRPVVIAVWGDAVIAGTINLSATLAATRTPAGSGIGCTSAVVGGDAPLGAGGGGGGGGQGHGGDGGDGGAADGGDGASSDSAPLDLRGGCEGAVGGEGGTIIVKGLAGPGGGGLAIVAQTSIAISGSIDAGGAGGGGGFGPNGGGGGGGSGGLIALDAPSIVNEGDLSANGGGGGGGAGNNGSPGFPGTDGQLGDVAAPGGTGTFGGLDGGAGSADTKLTGSDGPDDSGSDLGGGGGGGGAGFVIIWGPHGGAGIESPPAIEM